MILSATAFVAVTKKTVAAMSAFGLLAVTFPDGVIEIIAIVSAPAIGVLAARATVKSQRRLMSAETESVIVGSAKDVVTMLRAELSEQAKQQQHMAETIEMMREEIERLSRLVQTAMEQGFVPSERLPFLPTDGGPPIPPHVLDFLADGGNDDAPAT